MRTSEATDMLSLVASSFSLSCNSFDILMFRFFSNSAPPNNYYYTTSFVVVK